MLAGKQPTTTAISMDSEFDPEMKGGGVAVVNGIEPCCSPIGHIVVSRIRVIDPVMPGSGAWSLILESGNT